MPTMSKFRTNLLYYSFKNSFQCDSNVLIIIRLIITYIIMRWTQTRFIAEASPSCRRHLLAFLTINDNDQLIVYTIMLSHPRSKAGGVNQRRVALSTVSDNKLCSIYIFEPRPESSLSCPVRVVEYYRCHEARHCSYCNVYKTADD